VLRGGGRQHCCRVLQSRDRAASSVKEFICLSILVRCTEQPGATPTSTPKCCLSRCTEQPGATPTSTPKCCLSRYTVVGARDNSEVYRHNSRTPRGLLLYVLCACVRVCACMCACMCVCVTVCAVDWGLWEVRRQAIRTVVRIYTVWGQEEGSRRKTYQTPEYSGQMTPSVKRRGNSYMGPQVSVQTSHIRGGKVGTVSFSCGAIPSSVRGSGSFLCSCNI
jgi:hypothetical protein